MMVARIWGRGCKRYRVSLGDDKNVLEWDSGGGCVTLHVYEKINELSYFLYALFLFWSHCIACRVLVCQPEVKPVPRILTTGPPGNFQWLVHFKFYATGFCLNLKALNVLECDWTFSDLQLMNRRQIQKVTEVTAWSWRNWGFCLFSAGHLL